MHLPNRFYPLKRCSQVLHPWPSVEVNVASTRSITSSPDSGDSWSRRTVRWDKGYGWWCSTPTRSCDRSTVYMGGEESELTTQTYRSFHPPGHPPSCVQTTAQFSTLGCPNLNQMFLIPLPLPQWEAVCMGSGALWIPFCHLLISFVHGRFNSRGAQHTTTEGQPQGRQVKTYD